MRSHDQLSLAPCIIRIRILALLVSAMCIGNTFLRFIASAKGSDVYSIAGCWLFGMTSVALVIVLSKVIRLDNWSRRAFLGYQLLVLPTVPSLIFGSSGGMLSASGLPSAIQIFNALEIFFSSALGLHLLTPATRKAFIDQGPNLKKYTAAGIYAVIALLVGFILLNA